MAYFLGVIVALLFTKSFMISGSSDSEEEPISPIKPHLPDSFNADFVRIGGLTEMLPKAIICIAPNFNENGGVLPVERQNDDTFYNLITEKETFEMLEMHGKDIRRLRIIYNFSNGQMPMNEISRKNLHAVIAKLPEIHEITIAFANAEVWMELPKLPHCRKLTVIGNVIGSPDFGEFVPNARTIEFEYTKIIENKNVLINSKCLESLSVGVGTEGLLSENDFKKLFEGEKNPKMNFIKFPILWAKPEFLKEIAPLVPNLGVLHIEKAYPQVLRYNQWNLINLLRSDKRATFPKVHELYLGKDLLFKINPNQFSMNLPELKTLKLNTDFPYFPDDSLIKLINKFETLDNVYFYGLLDLAKGQKYELADEIKTAKSAHFAEIDPLTLKVLYFPVKCNVGSDRPPPSTDSEYMRRGVAAIQEAMAKPKDMQLNLPTTTDKCVKATASKEAKNTDARRKRFSFTRSKERDTNDAFTSFPSLSE